MSTEDILLHDRSTYLSIKPSCTQYSTSTIPVVVVVDKKATKGRIEHNGGCIFGIHYSGEEEKEEEEGKLPGGDGYPGIIIIGRWRGGILAK